MRPFAIETARKITACASLAIAFAMCTEVRAGTLPNISGTWYANGDGSKHCHITQSGSSVSLTSERGATATGSFADPGSLTTNWGPFGGGHITGRISGNLRTITWSNGTYWTRASAFSSASASSGFSSSSSVSSGYVAAAATPKPYRYLHSASPPGPRAPIDYVGSWTAIEPDATAGWTCLSFKNTGSVAATRILFGFALLNHNHEVIDTGQRDRKGTFSPDVEIHGYHDAAEWARRDGPRGYLDNCVVWDPNSEPPPRESYLQARYYSISVKRIYYADGTTWPQPEEASPNPEASSSPQPSPSPQR